jgi:hypothetical protein
MRAAERRTCLDIMASGYKKVLKATALKRADRGKS